MMGRIRDTGSKITSKFKNLNRPRAPSGRPREIPPTNSSVTFNLEPSQPPRAGSCTGLALFASSCAKIAILDYQDFLSPIIRRSPAPAPAVSPLLDRCEGRQTRNFRIRNDLETSKVYFSFLVDSTRAREHNRTME